MYRTDCKGIIDEEENLETFRKTRVSKIREKKGNARFQSSHKFQHKKMLSKKALQNKNSRTRREQEVSETSEKIAKRS